MQKMDLGSISDIEDGFGEHNRYRGWIGEHSRYRGWIWGAYQIEDDIWRHG